jgi:hypothetical protein
MTWISEGSEIGEACEWDRGLLRSIEGDRREEHLFVQLELVDGGSGVGDLTSRDVLIVALIPSVPYCKRVSYLFAGCGLGK